MSWRYCCRIGNGDLVAAFFGGTREKNPDCNIWTCRKPYGSKEWTKPYKAADGIYTKLTAAAFSESDLSKFAARDSIIDELLRDKPNVVQQDRFALFREAMLRMGEPGKLLRQFLWEMARIIHGGWRPPRIAVSPW